MAASNNQWPKQSESILRDLKGERHIRLTPSHRLRRLADDILALFESGPSVPLHMPLPSLPEIFQKKLGHEMPVWLDVDLAEIYPPAGVRATGNICSGNRGMTLGNLDWPDTTTMQSLQQSSGSEASTNSQTTSYFGGVMVRISGNITSEYLNITNSWHAGLA
ncbi:unnamed protein product [Protopolystoma xenopodis]|uniref:Uncharacterized protein n=1 Tax=Protopolystoma xenopodis TaxID=117903 RepID=A0A3S5AWM7_9PLAT|nr:unnamed protein product [Protopolystoma xenopodis]